MDNPIYEWMNPNLKRMIWGYPLVNVYSEVENHHM